MPGPMENLLDLTARNFPPPRFVGWPIRRLPTVLRERLLVGLLDRHLQALANADELEALEDQVLIIRISDIDLDMALHFAGGRLEPAAAEASPAVIISGGLGDFLALAGRCEDPDTLFFERRLQVSGNTAAGLLLRNLLDRMPADALPLPPRIILNRMARFSARLRRLRNA